MRIADTHRLLPSDKALHLAIWWRHTNRGPFENRDIPGWLRLELQEAAQVEAAQVEAAQLTFPPVTEAEADFMGDPAYREEIARWTT